MNEEHKVYHFGCMCKNCKSFLELYYNLCLKPLDEAKEQKPQENKPRKHLTKFLSGWQYCPFCGDKIARAKIDYHKKICNEDIFNNE